MTDHELRPQTQVRDRGSWRPGRRTRSEAGASAVEYGLLIAGIAALIAIAVFAFGGGANGMFQDSCATILEDSHIGGTCSN